MLTFNEDTHKYYWNGLNVPGVNEILSTSGISNYNKIPIYLRESALYFGKYIHKMTELFDLNDLDFDSIKDVVIDGKRPVEYLEGWIKYKELFKPIFQSIEKPLYSKIYNYAGTHDRVEDITVDDIKTGINSKSGDDLQLAAYLQLWNENYPDKKIKERRVIKLKPKEFEIAPCKNKQDFNDFRICLSIHSLRKKRGLL